MLRASILRAWGGLALLPLDAPLVDLLLDELGKILRAHRVLAAFGGQLGVLAGPGLLGQVADLLAEVPEVTAVGDAARVAAAHDEGLEGRGHEALALGVADGAGLGLVGLLHGADGLEDSVALLAEVFIQGHLSLLPVPSARLGRR